MRNYLRKAIFLDKDGTLVDNSLYPVVIPSDKILKNEIVDGLLYLQKKGYVFIIISNQSWIAKGRMTMSEVEAVFRSVCLQLEAYGIFITAYYYCPHQRSDNCQCKKPKTYLVEKAALEHDLDLSQSFMIGDMDDDIVMGKAMGLKTVQVLTGKSMFRLESCADYVIQNINNVREVI